MPRGARAMEMLNERNAERFRHKWARLIERVRQGKRTFAARNQPGDFIVRDDLLDGRRRDWPTCVSRVHDRDWIDEIRISSKHGHRPGVGVAVRFAAAPAKVEAVGWMLRKQIS